MREFRYIFDKSNHFSAENKRKRPQAAAHQYLQRSASVGGKRTANVAVEHGPAARPQTGPMNL
jgi:hypothetical protein